MRLITLCIEGGACALHLQLTPQVQATPASLNQAGV